MGPDTPDRLAPRSQYVGEVMSGVSERQVDLPTGVRRLNWGCGMGVPRGWINSDPTPGRGVDVAADIREGLPIESGTIDYAVSVHMLQQLAYPDLLSALAELRRVLRPGGTLRLVLPDLDAAIRAYAEHEDDRFADAAKQIRSRGGRFITHVLGGGESRTLFTFDFAEELLVTAGFVDVTQCRSGETASGIHEIVELDPPDPMSGFVEATRPPGKHPILNVHEIETLWHDGGQVVRAHLDGPEPGLISHDGTLEIVGWVVGKHVRATEVQIYGDGTSIGTALVELARRGVAREFAQSPGGRQAGFRARLLADGEGVGELRLNAALEDGSAVPLWTIRIHASGDPLVG